MLIFTGVFWRDKRQLELILESQKLMESVLGAYFTTWTYCWQVTLEFFLQLIRHQPDITNLSGMSQAKQLVEQRHTSPTTKQAALRLPGTHSHLRTWFYPQKGQELCPHTLYTLPAPGTSNTLWPTLKGHLDLALPTSAQHQPQDHYTTAPKPAIAGPQSHLPSSWYQAQNPQAATTKPVSALRHVGTLEPAPRIRP